MMINKNKRLLINDIILTVAFIVICIGIYVITATIAQKNKSDQIEVLQNGKLIDVLPLDEDTVYAVPESNYEIIIADKIVTVSKSDCKDRVCTFMKIDSDGGEIICLPNKIIVRHTEAKSTTAVDLRAG